MANVKCVSGICLIVTGVICLSLCLVLHFERESFVNYSVKSAIVIDSPDSPGYDGWVDGCNGDLPYIYESFWFYNLTNYHDVINNQTLPNFAKVGPYTYLECQVKQDIDFFDDNNKVRFSTNYTYHFEPSKSVGGESDIIINMNQEELVLATYMGNGKIIFGAPLFAYYQTMSKYFLEVFPQYALNQYSIGRLSKQQASLLGSYTEDEFQENWANATTQSLGADYDLWEGVLLSAVNNDQPSDISVESTNLLWNTSFPNNLLDESFEAQTLWLAAENDEEVNGVDAQTSLKDMFFLSDAELTIILNWRNQTKGELVTPFLAYINTLPAAKQSRSNHVHSLSDVGALQWSTCAVTQEDGHETVYDYPPHDTKEYVQNFHLGRDISKQAITAFLEKTQILIPSWFAPEMCYFETLDYPGLSSATWTVNEFNNLFGPGGFLVTTDGFSQYFTCSHFINSEIQPGGVKTACRFALKLHLSSSQENNLNIYNWDYLYDYITPAFSLPATGLGLIDARSVHERLWVGPLGLGGGNQSLQDPNTTWYTGKDDLYLAKQIYEWEDQGYLCSYNGPECTFFEGYWPVRQNISRTDGPVSGDGTQFPPGSGEVPDAPIYAWNSDIIRTVLLAWGEKVEVLGVNGYKYYVDNSTLVPDPGFDAANISGISNMTHLSVVGTAPIVDILNEKIRAALPSDEIVYEDVSNQTCLLPVYLTFPDMYLADPRYAETVTGLEVDPDEDEIYLVIEPVTGATIEAQKQLQYNILLGEEYQEIFDDTDYYHNITGPYGMVLWPVAVIDEHGTLNQETADELKILQDFPAIAKWALWVGVPFFSILIIIGGVLTFISCQTSRQDEYEALSSLN